MESFSCKVRNYIRMPTFALLLNIVEVLMRKLEERERKDIQIGREEVNLTLFVYDILYVENTKDSTKKLLDLRNKFSKITGYKVNTQKSVTDWSSLSQHGGAHVTRFVPRKGRRPWRRPRAVTSHHAEDGVEGAEVASDPGSGPGPSPWAAGRSVCQASLPPVGPSLSSRCHPPGRSRICHPETTSPAQPRR